MKLTDTEALNLHDLVLAVASAIFGELTRAPPGTPRFETPTRSPSNIMWTVWGSILLMLLAICAFTREKSI